MIKSDIENKPMTLEDATIELSRLIQEDTIGMAEQLNPIGSFMGHIARGETPRMALALVKNDSYFE